MEEGVWRATELREALPAVRMELREPPEELVAAGLLDVCVDVAAFVL